MERVKLLVPAPIVLILALAFLAGACSDRKPSLNGVLALIDSGSNRAGPELHVRAAALAFGTEARLRVLKRASLLDDTAYADVAAVFDRSGSLTEPVALGVFDAYMRDRRYREASRLFPRSLSAAEHPFLVAELVTASRSTGVFPGLDPRDYLAAAEAASIPALYVEGAIGALLQGQASVARQLLKEAVSRGVHVPAELLWDAGCHEALADSLPADGDPDSIEFAAAAAYLSGLEDRAAELCLYLLDSFPGHSWRPYAALARLGESSARESVPVTSAWDKISLPEEIAGPAAPPPDGLWHSRMLAAFPDSQEALLHYASWLVRTGRTREASDTLRKIGAVPESESLAIMARALMADAEPLRSRAIALELCAAFPDNPQAMDSALGILFSAGHMEDYRRLRVANPNLLPALERAAFWYAVDAVREGDYHAALTALRSHVAEGDDYALWYDMALVQGAMGRARDAAESFSAAASRAMDNRRGADALTRKASMLRRAGLYSEAKDAYGAAIALDPACAAARTGLSSLEAGRP